MTDDELPNDEKRLLRSEVSRSQRRSRTSLSQTLSDFVILSSFVIRHSSFVIRHSSFVIRHWVFRHFETSVAIEFVVITLRRP